MQRGARRGSASATTFSSCRVAMRTKPTLTQVRDGRVALARERTWYSVLGAPATGWLCQSRKTNHQSYPETDRRTLPTFASRDRASRIASSRRSHHSADRCNQMFKRSFIDWSIVTAVGRKRQDCHRYQILVHSRSRCCRQHPTPSDTDDTANSGAKRWTERPA